MNVLFYVRTVLLHRTVKSLLEPQNGIEFLESGLVLLCTTRHSIPHWHCITFLSVRQAHRTSNAAIRSRQSTIKIKSPTYQNSRNSTQISKTISSSFFSLLRTWSRKFPLSQRVQKLPACCHRPPAHRNCTITRAEVKTLPQQCRGPSPSLPLSFSLSGVNRS